MASIYPIVISIFTLICLCNGQDGRCEPIKNDLCNDLNYNSTVLPNRFFHTSQVTSQVDMERYRPWIRLKCSPVIKQFLCSLYTSKCTIYRRAIPPCRPLCLRAYLDCNNKSLLETNNFNISWNQNLNCDNFPPSGTQLCLNENLTLVYPPTTQRPNPSTNDPSSNACGKLRSDKPEDTFLGMQRCAKPCGLFFDDEQIFLASKVIGGMAVVSFMFTLFTLCTFLVDCHRFEYPERSIVFLVFCYCVISLTYMVGLAAERDIACNPATLSMNATVHQGSSKEGCTVLFLVNYFFSIASSVWWVVFSLGWYLEAGKKWAEEGINAVSHYFHLAAWLIPAILTIIVLAIGKIEGDSLSGICFVATRSDYLFGFVIAPLTFFLLVGIGFSVVNLVSLFRIRRQMLDDNRTGGGNEEYEKLLKKLFKKVGIFSLIYAIPAIIVIACYLYQAINQSQWITYWQKENCLRYSLTCSPDDVPVAVPNIAVFVLKYVAMFFFGIASCYWIWSRKTLASWKDFYLRIAAKKASDQDSNSAV